MSLDRPTSVSMAYANAAAAPLFVVIVTVSAFAYALVWGSVPYRTFNAMLEAHWLAIGGAAVASIVAHELLHGIAFNVFGGVSWKRIRFGVYWPLLTPFANSRSPVTARAYRMVCALPGLVLGLVPLAIAIAAQRPALMWYGAFMLGAASGDAVALWASRGVAAERVVVDCEDRVGCVVLDSTA